eukprot:scaffold515336_cov67-Attheya_sp.AAC.1
MTDLAGFTDYLGFTCSDYEPSVNPTWCDEFGNVPGAEPTFSDVTVNEACLICGACEFCTGKCSYNTNTGS